MSRDFRIDVFDKNYTKVGELSSTISYPEIIDIQFDFNEIGCGEFSFNTSDEAPFGISYNYKIEIYPLLSSTSWFSGYIMEIPMAGDTNKVKTYSGYGFFNQLKDIIVDTSYTSMTIEAIAKDIIQNTVAPNTDILYDATKFEATGVTVNSIEFKKVNAKKSLTDLMNLVSDFIIGVGQDRKFYLKQKSTTINVTREVGTHLESFEPVEDITKIVNKLYVKYGNIDGTSRTNFVTIVEDTASQNKYGLKEGIINAPTMDNSTDVTAWANVRLNQLKESEQRFTIKNEDVNQYNDKIIAEGKARIITLPIK